MTETNVIIKKTRNTKIKIIDESDEEIIETTDEKNKVNKNLSFDHIQRNKLYNRNEKSLRDT